MDLEMVLNELSLLTPAADIPTAQQWMSDFITTVRTATAQGVKKFPMPNESANDRIPPGFKLRHTLQGHTDIIVQMAWSPDGQILALLCSYGSIWLWNAQTGKLFKRVEENFDNLYTMAWSPDGQTLGSGTQKRTIRIWDTETGELCQSLQAPCDRVFSMAWSPDGRTLASASYDKTIRLWEQETGKLRRTFRGHSGSTKSLAWFPLDRLMIASASDDCTVRLWNVETGQQTNILEGNISGVTSVSFSYDGRLLTSMSSVNTVRYWRCDTWEAVGNFILTEPDSGFLLPTPSLAFHPKASVLATLDNCRAICI